MPVTQGWVETLLRLGAALVAGGLVGLERQMRGRPAGLRTHMLVSLGAAVIVSITLGGDPGDSSRAVQGIATGIGFLCAGDIFRQVTKGEEHVKGLTSAASLWVTAALGMTAASGKWAVTFGGTVGTLLTLTIAQRAERVIPIRPAPHDDAREETR
jgi:putative Mg2+ transporter-C (MgtC) family protein